MHPQDRAPEGSTACAARFFCAADDEGDKHTCHTGRTTSLAIYSGKSHPGSPIGARLVHGAHRGAADGEHARTRATHRRQKPHAPRQALSGVHSHDEAHAGHTSGWGDCGAVVE